MISKKKFENIFFGMVLMFLILGQTVMSSAQFGLDESYEVSVEVPVVQNDFVKARKKAVSIALRSALEQDLREVLGEDDFEQNRQEIKKMLKVSNKYVKSYRFLEAYDDSIELMSRIKIEVFFFQEAISKALNTRGLAVGFETVKQVVILINESNLSSSEDINFWESVPISEMLLTRSFIEAGIPVVRRNSLRYEISKKIVVAAIEGDISAAVNIGSKVGADIVIMGNATSAFAVDRGSLEGQKVRVGINVKVVSSSQSEVIAAKSDFATVSENEIFSNELEAFHQAGKKITEFLIPTIERHWTPSSKKRETQRPITQLPKTDNSPLPFGDL
jgi:hypothetical protein